MNVEEAECRAAVVAMRAGLERSDTLESGDSPRGFRIFNHLGQRLGYVVVFASHNTGWLDVWLKPHTIS